MIRQMRECFVSTKNPEVGGIYLNNVQLNVMLKRVRKVNKNGKPKIRKKFW